MSMLLRSVVVLWLVASAPIARGDDVFSSVEISKLQITEGALPEGGPTHPRRWERAQLLVPYVVLDGAGEAYTATPNASTGFDSGWLSRWSGDSAAIVVRVPSAGDVSGVLMVPDAGWDRLVRVRFTLKADTSDAGARAEFFRAKAVSYEWLQALGGPGGPFFRRQADLAWRDVPNRPDDAARRRARRQMGVRDLDDTYNLFTGGRAVAENLQLNRELPEGRDDDDGAERTVPVGSLEGITVASIDWSARLSGQKPAIDALSAAIPADQHVAFFPSFESLMTVLDRTNEDGLPVFRGLAARSEDGRIVERYERQLCLSRSGLSRLLGPGVIKSLAVTGSDPYFPTGTDVAVLFQPADAKALRTLILAQVRLLSQSAGAKAVSGTADGVDYEGAVSGDRSVSAYVAQVGDAIVVTNSLVQLSRLAAVKSGRSAALGSLPEFQYFRSRYAVGEEGETTFLFLSDATIRRWCGAEWRVGASRRLRAAAILADATAAHAEELNKGVGAARTITAETPMRTLGTLTLGPSGVGSSVYGTLGFLTPICELKIEEVFEDEAAAYKRWRDTYQRNWSWAFDPIGVRLGVQKERLPADLTIMPLIASSEYRTWMSVAQGASLTAFSGDPHDALVQGVLAIDPESAAAKQAGGFARMMAPGVEFDPLGWLGGALSVYADADADPFWGEMLDAEEPDVFFRDIVGRLPVGLHVEVSSALKLTAFLTAARSFVEQTAPGMTEWETLTHNDQPYVRVGASEKAREDAQGFDKISLYYAATPSALIVTLNQDLLKRAVDRQAQRAIKKEAPPAGWLGSSMGLRFTRDGLALAQGPGRTLLRDSVQRRSWLNILILNEWKRRFPGKDPSAVHERLWGTTLLCPGGGKYVWDADCRTMASTVFGHPGAPKPGPEGFGPLEALRAGELGLTFEGDGLRARAVIDRGP